MGGQGAPRRFGLALAVSLALHLGVVALPGWELPREEAPVALAASLVAPPPAPPAIAAAPRSPPKRKATPRLPTAPAPGAPPSSAPPSSVSPSLATSPEPSEFASPSFAPAPEETGVSPESGPAPPPAPTLIGRLPPAGQIVYQVTRGESFLIGQSEQRWRHDGVHYQLRAETRTTGLAALFRPLRVVQESRGIFDEHGLRPLEFDRWQDDALKESIRFDLDAGQVRLGEARTAFVAGAQDLLSVFYQLGVSAAQAPRAEVTVATGRRLAVYAVTIGAPTEVELPQGARIAHHYTISAGPTSDVTEVWLDIDTLLPIKIRHRDKKGEVFEQLATHIELE